MLFRSEMAFAGHCGLDIALSADVDALSQLFAEELGIVLQVSDVNLDAVQACFARHALSDLTTLLGKPSAERRVRIRCAGQCIDESLLDLRHAWSETSYRMRRLRDDPDCAREEFAAQCASDAAPLVVRLSFDPRDDIAAPYIARGARPKVAVLREQGVNSQVEMAAVLDRAGFEPHDVHMSDLAAGARALSEFRALVACGGFSFGDVLGAGEGWAKSILFNTKLRDEFSGFFARGDTLSLGVCNGCQMFAALKEIIPGAADWPRFVRNRSEQFEARFSLLEIAPSGSYFFADMAGSVLPIAVAHGEGRAEFANAAAAAAFDRSGLVSCRYISQAGMIAATYPANPNGSPFGIAAIASDDGRVTLTMPHPERSFRTLQNSWTPPGSSPESGWMRMFRNARRWMG